MKRTPADIGIAAAKQDAAIERIKALAEERDSSTDDYANTFAHLGMMDDLVLLAAARGDIDLNVLAKQAMADRGFGRDGEWVGFDRARVEWFERYETVDRKGNKILVSIPDSK